MQKSYLADPERVRKIMKAAKFIPRNPIDRETILDKIQSGKFVRKAKGKKGKPTKYEKTDSKKLESSIRIRYDSGELMVITKAKQLTSYIITITEKSPKKFRFSFVSKLHNYCLDMMESLVVANYTRKENPKREELQMSAFGKMKLIGYMSLLACENDCILPKQFEQISFLLSDLVNLFFAWRQGGDRKNNGEK